MQEKEVATMYFASNLKYLRLKNNLEQKDVAEIVGVTHYTTISKWERGKSEPRAYQLIRLAEYFGVTLDDLIKNDLTK
jgi:repressor LexA